MIDNTSDKINLNVLDSKDAQDEGVFANGEKRELRPSGPSEGGESEEFPVADETSQNKCVDIDEALQLAEDNRDKWMRAVAEFENYKKRSIQERSKFQKYRNEELLRDLLPVMDNLERAIAASDAKSAGPLLDGVKMTANMFKDVLSRFGVKPIESVGGPFNPEFQEAIATLNDPGRDTNSVIEELEKGYMYQDRLLRPAKVVVSTK